MEPVIVYWRPMCGYCEILKRDLTRRGIDFVDVDIWRDREKADIVRAANNGDEVVPTVQVGQRFFVNPTAEEIVAATEAA